MLAFVREKKASPVTKDTDEKKLADLISDVGNKRLREMWTTPDDLRSKVGMALLKAITEDREDGSARPGWYRGSDVEQLTSENQALRLEIERHKATPVKEETTFEIKVVDQEGDPPPEVTFRRVLPRSPQNAAGAYPDVDDKIMALLALEDRSPTPEEKQAHNRAVTEYLSKQDCLKRIQEYTLAEALKFCTRIAFAIRNVSGPTATDVRCEIRFPDGFTLHCGSLPKRALPYDLSTAPD